MAHITQAQRSERIKELLNELNKMPPERHEVERLPWAGDEPLLCQVVGIGIDEVLLNHNSHRVRAQLEDDPEWQAVENDPTSQVAQRVIERHVRAARTPEQFAALKESLQREGQTSPGVMTHKGVMVNANTRVVALRELNDPNRSRIRVAVLPPVAQPEDLALLELRLQMQKELKVDYSLTNELIFIDELSSQRGLEEATIARELRIFPESERKGITEVQLRLRMLDLVRTMQRVPDEPLRLTFFDTLGYQQLRELLSKYHALVESDPNEAQTYLESFLLHVSLGVTAVHQIRVIDSTFMSDYMLPQLEEDEIVGAVADDLCAPDATTVTPSGSGGALLHKDNDDGTQQVDVRRLVNIVTRRDKRVVVPGTSFAAGRDVVREALETAIKAGIKEKKRAEKEADKMEAPATSVKAAIREVAKALAAVKDVATDPDFDQKRRKSLEYAYNKLKRSCRDLESALTDANVIGD